MPVYIFQNPETKEYREVLLGMQDKKEFSEGGVKWDRVFTKPNAAVSTAIDPYSAESFVSATANKKETYGDLMDRSRELSEKRKDKEGVDPLRTKEFENYSKLRRGIKHPEQKKQESQERLKKLGVSVEI